MIFRKAVLLICLLLPVISMGQQKKYQLAGYVYIRNGDTCRFELSFIVTDNKVMGTSVTKTPGGRELKAIIKGTLDRKQQTLSFTESKISKVSFTQACMFDVSLTYKLRSGHYYFNGTFKGKNNSGENCDEGTVKLEMKKDEDGLFETEQHEAAASSRRPTGKLATGKPEAPVNFDKLTSAKKKEFIWDSDTCVFEIWDGEVVDGDIVTIVYNYKLVLSNYSLIGAKKQLRLPVEADENTLSIFAENEGKAPPNTSMTMLTDGKKRHGVFVCIKKGESADIIIRKRKKILKS